MRWESKSTLEAVDIGLDFSVKLAPFGRAGGRRADQLWLIPIFNRRESER